MRSIGPPRAILGDELLAEFARMLEQCDLSPVTARGCFHCQLRPLDRQHRVTVFLIGIVQVASVIGTAFYPTKPLS